MKNPFCASSKFDAFMRFRSSPSRGIQYGKLYPKSGTFSGITSENQSFLAYINKVGKDRAFGYAGLSIIAAPDGKVLVSVGIAEEQLTADIEPAYYVRSCGENTYLAALTVVGGDLESCG